uniref:Uncharacterized protein n=1 Tax=viral metagenome TaxID=1070528 RepID=A0A6M3IDN7_9ZZZZ
MIIYVAFGAILLYMILKQKKVSMPEATETQTTTETPVQSTITTPEIILTDNMTSFPSVQTVAPSLQTTQGIALIETVQGAVIPVTIPVMTHAEIDAEATANERKLKDLRTQVTIYGREADYIRNAHPEMTPSQLSEHPRMMQLNAAISETRATIANLQTRNKELTRLYNSF